MSPPRTPSGEVESPVEGSRSVPRPLSNGSKKRVLFGTCQMFAYDPEAPPADGGDDDMCEVPLLPASPQAQHPIVSSALSSAPVLHAVGGSGAMLGGTQVPSQGDSILFPLKTGPAVRRGDDGPEAGAIPVLCFDVHQGAGENEMEGALRVTTAEALELSEAELDAMHESLEERHGTGGEQPGESAAHNGKGRREEETASGRPPPQRRPRLRQRGRSPAPPVQRGLEPEAQHDLQRQAMADMFRCVCCSPPLQFRPLLKALVRFHSEHHMHEYASLSCFQSIEMLCYTSRERGAACGTALEDKWRIQGVPMLQTGVACVQVLSGTRGGRRRRCCEVSAAA